MKLLFYFVIFFSWNLAKGLGNESIDDCMSDQCYRNVNTEHLELIQIINNGKHIIESAKFPKTELPFQDLLEKLEQFKGNISNNHKNVDNIVNELEHIFNDVLNNTNFTNEVIDKLRQGTNTSQLDNILEKVRNHLHSLETLVTENEKASETCSKTNKQYNSLEKETEELLNEYLELKKNLEATQNKITIVNEEIDKTTNDSYNNIVDFDELKLPYSLEKEYIDKLKNHIRTVLDNIKANKKDLEEALKELYNNRSEVLKSQINEVKKLLADLRDMLETIQNSLREYEDAIPKSRDYEFIVDDEVKKLIKNLDELIKKIETQIKGYEEELLKLIDEFHKNKEIWEQTMKKFLEIQDILKAEKILLELLNSIDKYKYSIQFQLYKANTSLQLISRRDTLKKEVEKLKRIYDELIKYGQPEICVRDVKFENKK